MPMPFLRLKIIFPLSFMLLDRKDALEDGRGDDARRKWTPSQHY